jgi:hypothetical protein
MNNPNDNGPTVTVARADAGHNNGQRPSLGDRVRSLRLSGASQGGGRARGSALAWILCAVLLFTTALFGYRAYRLSPVDSAAGVETDSTKDSASGFGSPVTTSQAGSGAVALEQKGYVVPAHQIQVSPKITGIIVWLAGDELPGGALGVAAFPAFKLEKKFQEGQRFNKDDLLAVLEDVDYRADRDHATAALEGSRRRDEELNKRLPLEVIQAEAKLAESRALETQRLNELARAEESYRKNALSRDEYDRAKYTYEAQIKTSETLEVDLRTRKVTVKVRLDASAADARQAEHDLVKAQWRLDNCMIRAPVTGTILSKKAEKGNLVIPSAFSSQGGLSASLCDMADLSDLEVEVAVQERDRASVLPGQPCIVMPEAWQRDPEFRKRHPNGYKGYVSRLLPIADRAKGAVTAKVKLNDGEVPREEEGVFLVPEMGVIVSFLKMDAKKGK